MKKLVVIGAIVSVLSVGAVSFAMQSDQPVKQNQASLQRSEAVESSAMQSSAEQSQSTPEVKNDTVQPVQNEQPQIQAQTAPAVAEEPFDAQSYGLSLLAEKSRQGVNMNAECYNKLMVESTGWNMTKDQVDAAFQKVLGYSSTCAAYANFQATGSF